MSQQESTTNTLAQDPLDTTPPPFDRAVALDLQALEDLIPTSSDRPTDCHVKQTHFVYPGQRQGQRGDRSRDDDEDRELLGPEKNQVKILRPCGKANCRSCRKHNAQLIASLMHTGDNASSTTTAMPTQRLPTRPTVWEPQGDVRYEEDRVRPKMRRRLVLKFTKPSLDPSADNNFKSARFNAFKMYIQGNNIPRYTGVSKRLTVLKFDAKREAFKSLVERWEAERLAIVEDDDEEPRDGVRIPELDDANELGGGGDDVGEADPAFGENENDGWGLKREADEEWWDEVTQSGKKQRRFDKFEPL